HRTRSFAFVSVLFALFLSLNTGTLNARDADLASLTFATAHTAKRHDELQCPSDLARLSRFCGLTCIRPCRGASMSAIKSKEIATTSGRTRASFPAFRTR